MDIDSFVTNLLPLLNNRQDTLLFRWFDLPATDAQPS